MALLESFPRPRTLAPGVDLLCLPERRFKRVLLHLHFDRPLDARRPARSLLCQILDHGTERHSTRQELACAEEDLYGVTVAQNSDRHAGMQRTTLRVSWVGEEFLPEGARVTEPVLELARERFEAPLRAASGAPFPAETLEREREQLLRQIRTFPEHRSAYAREQFLQAMCAGEPYGLPPWGTAEEVVALTGEDLEAARVDLLDHARVTAVAVGPVDPERLAGALADWLGPAGLRGGAAREVVPLPRLVEPGAMRERRETQPVDQAKFHYGWRAPRPVTGPQVETQALMNDVVGGMHGRLFRIVREERSLAYGIYSSSSTFVGMWTVAAGIDANSFDEVLRTVDEQVADVAAGNLTDAEIEVARVGLLHDLDSLGDSASRLARSLDREHLLGLYRSPAERAAQLRKLGAADVAAAAGRLRPDLVHLVAAAETAAIVG